MTRLRLMVVAATALALVGASASCEGSETPRATCDGREVTVDLSLDQIPTEGNDVILGTAGPDRIDAQGGDDVVCGGGGDDTIFGGRGDDRLFGNGHGPGSRVDDEDELSGGPGIDDCDGGSGVDEADHSCEQLVSVEKQPPYVVAVGDQLVDARTGSRFYGYGLNYLGSSDEFLEELWETEWDVVLGDLADMRDLGANVVHVHPQLAEYMSGPADFDSGALTRLEMFVDAAEAEGLHVVIVGLGVNRVGSEPAWLDALDETDRWGAQAAFWHEIACRFAGEPNLLYYDLMNAPRVPESPQSTWYIGRMGDRQWHQVLTQDLAGRSAEALGAAWVAEMIAAIRECDSERMISVGTYADPDNPGYLTTRSVTDQLDLVSPHFYAPGTSDDQRELTRDAVREFDVGLPIYVSETFPLRTSVDEWESFLRAIVPVTSGFATQYRVASEIEQVVDAPVFDPKVFIWLAVFHAFSRVASAAS